LGRSCACPIFIYGDYPLDKVALRAYHREQGEYFKKFVAFLGDKYLACLAAYFDDSGSHSDSPITAMGGIVASADEWNKFTSEWHERLEADGIAVFHMADCQNGSGEFREDWTQERKDVFVKDLTEIINRNVQLFIGVVVPQVNFDVAKLDFPTVTKSPIEFCADYSCVQLAVWAEKSDDRKNMAMVFDDGSKIMKEMLNLFSGKNKPDWNKVYGSRKKNIPLQAADLFAYELFRRYRSQVEGKQIPIRRAMKTLLEGKELYLIPGEVETIKDYFRDLPLLNAFA
jgi:hypothetical protein